MIDNMMVEPGLSERENGRRMRKAGVFFLLLVLLELPLSGLVSMVQGAFPQEYRILISLLMTQSYLLGSAVLFIRLTGISGRELGLGAFRPRSLVWMLLLLCASGIVAQWLNLFSQLFVKNEASRLVSDVTQVLPVWAGILLIGCLPGIAEELIYRGILYSIFRKKSVFTGVIVSALSFGLMHMNLNQIAYAVFMGVLFALVVEATGSLLSSMLMHAVFNSVNVVLLYLSAEIGTESAQEMKEQAVGTAELLHFLAILTPAALLALFLTVRLLRGLAQANGRSFSGEDGGKGTGKAYTLPLLAGWVVCLLLAMVNMLLE